MSVVAAIMALGAATLIIEHKNLYSQRDVLNRAAAAASLAATQRMTGAPAGQDEDALQTELESVARNWVLLNLSYLPKTRFERARDSLELTVAPDRENGTVEVLAKADLGGSILARHLGITGHYKGPEKALGRAGAEQLHEAVWAILAIDVSNSMNKDLDGQWANPPNRRFDIVGGAARLFVDSLSPDRERGVAIGVVPWDHDVVTRDVLAPSTDRQVITRRIDRLASRGGATRSSAGLQEGRRQLANAPEDARKVLVLLTDGEDNRLSATESCYSSAPRCLQPRRDQCRAAKGEGIEIFTVTAMSPMHVSAALGQELTACASSSDHAFLNNSDAGELRDAFSTIAASLKPLRLTH